MTVSKCSGEGRHKTDFESTLILQCQESVPPPLFAPQAMSLPCFQTLVLLLSCSGWIICISSIREHHGYPITNMQPSKQVFLRCFLSTVSKSYPEHTQRECLNIPFKHSHHDHNLPHLSGRQPVCSAWDIQLPAVPTDTENTTQAKFQATQNDATLLLSSVEPSCFVSAKNLPISLAVKQQDQQSNVSPHKCLVTTQVLWKLPWLLHTQIRHVSLGLFLHLFIQPY